MTEHAISHPGHAALHHDPEAAKISLAAMEEAELRALKAKQRWYSRAFFAGRLLLGGMFVVGALSKTLTFGQTRAAMSDFGLEAAGLLLTIAIALEAVAGAMLLVGYRARGAALTLAIWLGVITVVIYGNLTLEVNRMFALANLSIAGGLLMIFGHGAGDYSVDKRLLQKAARES